MDGRIDGWTDGWMDGWVGGWVGGWVDGWMDGLEFSRTWKCPTHPQKQMLTLVFVDCWVQAQGPMSPNPPLSVRVETLGLNTCKALQSHNPYFEDHEDIVTMFLLGCSACL